MHLIGVINSLNSLCFSLPHLSLGSGEKQYKLEELMPIYQEILNSKSSGTSAEFNEAFKTFDREGQGFVSAAELRHCLAGMGKHPYTTMFQPCMH